MIKEKVLLKDYTNYKIGGPAKLFLATDSVKEIIDTVKKYPQEKIFILGGGTNILVGDRGFDGLVIHYGNPKIELFDNTQGKQPASPAGESNSLIKTGSGASMESLNNYCVDHSLSGLEWSGGLPGTVGGAIFGNAGAFGGETKDNIVEVESLDIESLNIKKRTNDACEFGYRSSIFKEKRSQKEIILSATFKMRLGDSAEINRAINEKISYRKEHQPLEFPSAGSTFKGVPLEKIPSEIKEKLQDKIKNDPFPLIPAAVFLADAGLKGMSVGGAEVSKKHPNFIINSGSATAQDVENLIQKITDIVREKYHIVLETEIIRA